MRDPCSRMWGEVPVLSSDWSPPSSQCSRWSPHGAKSSAVEGTGRWGWRNAPGGAWVWGPACGGQTGRTPGAGAHTSLRLRVWVGGGGAGVQQDTEGTRGQRPSGPPSCEPGLCPTGSWKVPARINMPGFALLVFVSPHTEAPVGSALIGFCLAVAENKLIPLQLFLQRLSRLSPRAPAVPLTASPLLWEHRRRGLRVREGSWSSVLARAPGPRAGPAPRPPNPHPPVPEPLEATAAGQKPHLCAEGGVFTPQVFSLLKLPRHPSSLKTWARCHPWAETLPLMLFAFSLKIQTLISHGSAL